MARRPRIEVEGGLYHVFTRGNNRKIIFNSDEDCEKFSSLLAIQKARLPFYLYAYCLMPNHVHLLIERRKNAISRVMQRLLTGYSLYFNRKYQKVGHLFQGRYKSILCQTDQYGYSGHVAYLRPVESSLVDTDALLRYFGARKSQARKLYRLFVQAGMGQGSREELYETDDGRLLGSDEFVEETKRRAGEIPIGAQPTSFITNEIEDELEINELINAVEKASGISRSEFCSGARTRCVVEVREAMILTAITRGVSQGVLCEALGIESSVMSRRLTAARTKMQGSAKFNRMLGQIEGGLTQKP
jgi:putative transposase